MHDRWTSFRNFWFAYDRAGLQGSETSKVSQIAEYTRRDARPFPPRGVEGEARMKLSVIRFHVLALDDRLQGCP